MVMKIYHKLDYEVTYNFGIHHNHIKHYLHHENNCTIKTAHAAQHQRYNYRQKTDRHFREA